MSESAESALRQANEELQMLFDGSAEGILVANTETQRFVRVNRAICERLGYSKEELLSLSVADIHPAKSLPDVLAAFETMCQGRLKYIQNLPCLRRDGSVVYADVTANPLSCQGQELIVGFLCDTTEQNQIIDLLRASEERYRFIADNVADVIWMAPVTLSDSERASARANVAAVVDAVLERWRFSYVSPSAERVFGYTADDAARLSLLDITAPASHERIRKAMIERFTQESLGMGDAPQQHALEAECLAKDGSSRWCEVVTTYLRNDEGLPTTILGITRDISERQRAEQALRESESKLRSLFENLPDIVVTVDRNSTIQFANRGGPNLHRELLFGASGFGLVTAEYQEASRRTLDQAFATGLPQTLEVQDISGHWWLCRAVPLAKEGDNERTMIICTDITQERLAAEAVNKEQRLLRQLLELHERDRRLTAYDIHDGFAQQLTGALYRLQGFRELYARNSVEAWRNFDVAIRLISRAIDETRWLISNLRPPILDELGVVHAIEYLVCEHSGQGGPTIEFMHEVAFERLAPPLESAIFRIVQELLQNACRHSRSDKIGIELIDRDGRIRIDVRDWGVGFSPEAVEEQRFGLQGIRERVRLLEGRVVIASVPGQGTHISVELPMVDAAGSPVKATESDRS